ncbi:MAG: IS200/IS605 family transposase [Candidatus Moranbacteria bacterium]|nr:IS200/IS605 family transposase [Candidatus Moranbacteria bacterium]
MKHYRITSHALYDLKYHVCWITKYRYPILRHQIAIDTREIIRNIATSLDARIITGAVGKDHVHLFLSVPPKVFVSKLMQKLKGTTSYKLQQKYPQLKKRYWGQYMWARGYFAVSSGHVTDQMWMEYIDNQENTDDPNKFTNLKITD